METRRLLLLGERAEERARVRAALSSSGAWSIVESDDPAALVGGEERPSCVVVLGGRRSAGELADTLRRVARGAGADAARVVVRRRSDDRGGRDEESAAAREQAELELLEAGAHEVCDEDGLARAIARSRARAGACGTSRWSAAARTGRVGCFEWEPDDDRLRTWGELAEGRSAESMSELLSWIDPRDATRVEAVLHEALAHGAPFSVAFRWREPSDSWAIARGTLGARGGTVLGAISDVTELRLELDAAEFVLDAERTARRRAEHANRAHDEFLAVVSHELRTPLSAVLGWAQILRAGKYEERHLAKAIEVIERNAKAQERIVSDLLDVGRVIAGKLVIDHVRLRLTDPVRIAADSLRSAAEQAHVQLQIGPLARDAWVFGDPGRLQQVASNLIGNAIKFTPAGGKVEVKVELAGDRTRLVVTDSGAGMSPADLAAVFERFQQAHVQDRRRGGLGLGLAITKQLVELHGGAVSATSAGDGHGSTFTVELPAANAADRVEVELALFTDTPALAGQRILLVDDDPDSIELAQLVLRQSRADVHIATTSSGALSRFRAERWDAVISDLGLPDYDGYQLIRRMRESERRAGAPRTVAVCATAFARDADRDRAIASGFDAHLAKPIPPHLLVTTVLGLLRRDGTHPAIVAGHA